VDTTKHRSQVLASGKENHPTRVVGEAPLLGVRKSDQQDSCVATRREAPPIREVEILGDQKAFFELRRLPDLAVDVSTQLFFDDGMDIMTESREPDRAGGREILVQLDPHATLVSSGAGPVPADPRWLRLRQRQ